MEAKKANESILRLLIYKKCSTFSYAYNNLKYTGLDKCSHVHDFCGVLGISLLIPEGAIPQGRTEELFLASSSDMEQNPRLLHKSDTILSATVFAGPPHTVLLKPAILSFDQSASRNSSDHWTTSLYTQTPNAHWKVDKRSLHHRSIMRSGHKTVCDKISFFHRDRIIQSTT